MMTVLAALAVTATASRDESDSDTVVFIVRADVDGMVAEIDERNNLKVLAVTVP